MRQSIIVSCATAAYLACFATVYLSFQAAPAPIRALVGGGMFFLLALLLLWKDGVRAKAKPRLVGNLNPAAGEASH